MKAREDKLRYRRDEATEEGPSPLKVPWPIWAITWYYHHPLLGYLLLFGASAVWALTPRGPDAAALTLLIFPWLLFGLVILHLPLLRAAFKRLTLPLPVRRNHALEHGTIQLLERAYGVTNEISGRAAFNGFRLSGAKNQGDIERAFAEFLALPHDQRLALAVTNRCGSMLVFAQGLGVVLLIATLLVVTVWRPQPREAGILLALQLLLFVLGRGPLGRYLQARRFLALDFSTACIERIEKVHPRTFEEPPVFFVRTKIEKVGSRG